MSAQNPSSALALERDWPIFETRWKRWILALALIGFTGWPAYRSTFSAPFIFDDLPGVVRNSTIRALWPLDDVLLPRQETGTSVVGRPVVNFTLALNYAWGGLAVRGYHVFNLLVHVASGLLLFAVLRRTWLLPSLRDRFSAVAGLLALAVALAWTLHPLQTESVSCVIQRTELLVAFFYLLTFYAFLRTAETPSRHWSFVAVGACFLGMMTKEVMVTAPVLLFLYDRTFLAGSFAAAWRARRGLYLALAATWLPLIFLVARSGGRGGTVGFELGVTSWDYLLTQCRALVLYLQLTLWPSGLVLDYGMGVARSVGEVFPQLALLLVLGGGTVWAIGRQPVLGFIGAGFFVLLAPSSSVVPLATQTIAEHRMYLPLAVLLAAGMAGLHRLAGRRALTVAGVVLLACGGLTAHRNTAYATAISIWGDTVAKVPENARARYNFANALADAGRPAEAVPHYESALKREPRYSAAHFNLASALLRLGREREAIDHYEQVLAFEPDSTDAHANLAGALVRLGRMAEAVTHYEIAARRGKLVAEEHRHFGRALAEVGRMDDAVRHLQEAIQLEPRVAESHVMLGMVLSVAGRATEALPHFSRATEIEPGDPGSRLALADALLETSRPADALPHYEAALRLQPQAAVIHTSLGKALVRLGRLEEAATHFETALRFDSTDSEARAMLARVRGLRRP